MKRCMLSLVLLLAVLVAVVVAKDDWGEGEPHTTCEENRDYASDLQASVNVLKAEVKDIHGDACGEYNDLQNLYVDLEPDHDCNDCLEYLWLADQDLNEAFPFLTSSTPYLMNGLIQWGSANQKFGEAEGHWGDFECCDASDDYLASLPIFAVAQSCFEDCDEAVGEASPFLSNADGYLNLVGLCEECGGEP